MPVDFDILKDSSIAYSLLCEREGEDADDNHYLGFDNAVAAAEAHAAQCGGSQVQIERVKDGALVWDNYNGGVKWAAIKVPS